MSMSCARVHEHAHLLRESKKSGFAADIQKVSQVHCKAGLTSKDVTHVVDGSSLIARLLSPGVEHTIGYVICMWSM